MSTSAPVIAPQQPAPAGSARSGRPHYELGRVPYLHVAVLALVIAALSMLYPWAPAYDPWAWIIWGRELAHLRLHTFGGPTWKPLPVLFTTAFAPFGSAAPALWVLVARAGGVLGVLLASLLAFRLAGPRRVAAVVGALAVAAGVLALSQYVASVAGGESEGLLLAFTLLAIMRHLDGRPAQALTFAFAATLIRPETWLFFAAYCAWLWRGQQRHRPLILALLALIPVLWFVPDLIGSGSLTRGVEWAQYAKAGSPAFAHCPFCAELTGHAWPLLAAPFRVGVALALGVLVASGLGASRQRVLLAVLGLGFLWIVEEALFTQAGFSGSDRYLLAPVALLVVAGGVGWAGAMRARVALPAVAVSIALGLLSPSPGPHFTRAAADVRYQALLARDLQAAVSGAGGTPRMLACGPVQTNPSESPLAAWTLGVPMRQTESSAGAVVIRSRNDPDGALRPAVRAGRDGYRLLARAGAVTVLSRCR